MRQNQSKHLRPWLLCVAAGLTAAILGYVMRDSPGPINEGPGFCTVPLVIFLQSSLIGCIGAYYRNWWVTLAGTVCMVVIQFFVQTIFQGYALNVDPAAIAVISGFAFFPAVTIHSLWHAVVTDLRNRRLKPGYCATCGYNLTGTTSGICPECGEKIQSVFTPEGNG